MKLDITEEEREFLERLCSRAEMFYQLSIATPNKSFSNFNKDLLAIQPLIIKLRKIDTN
jgi:hypothetical protein